MIGNNKSQITNYKQYPITKITNSKQRFHNEQLAQVDQNAKSILSVVLVIEISYFEFICNLVLVFWDFCKIQKNIRRLLPLIT
jgi:hypothetical protein